MATSVAARADLLMSLAASIASAQHGTVRGVVRESATGRLVPGVIIEIRKGNTVQAARSDEAGEFRGIEGPQPTLLKPFDRRDRGGALIPTVSRVLLSSRLQAATTNALECSDNYAILIQVDCSSAHRGESGTSSGTDEHVIGLARLGRDGIRQLRRTSR